MNHLNFFLLPLLLLIISCSEKEPTETTTYTDTELRAKIVGTWSNVYTNIKFESNGNFTENIDINYTFGDTMVNQAELIKGTYMIESGILSKNIDEWIIINNSNLGMGYIPPASKIIIDQNLLY